LTLKTKIDSVIRHPSIIKDIIQFKNAEEIRAKIRRLDEMQAERLAVIATEYIINNKEHHDSLTDEQYVLI
jgi:hypothetical protein